MGDDGGRGLRDVVQARHMAKDLTGNLGIITTGTFGRLNL